MKEFDDNKNIKIGEEDKEMLSEYLSQISRSVQVKTPKRSKQKIKGEKNSEKTSSRFDDSMLAKSSQKIPNKKETKKTTQSETKPRYINKKPVYDKGGRKKKSQMKKKILKIFQSLEAGKICFISSGVNFKNWKDEGMMVSNQSIKIISQLKKSIEQSPINPVSENIDDYFEMDKMLFDELENNSPNHKFAQEKIISDSSSLKSGWVNKENNPRDLDFQKPLPDIAHSQPIRFSQIPFKDVPKSQMIKRKPKFTIKRNIYEKNKENKINSIKKNQKKNKNGVIYIQKDEEHLILSNKIKKGVKYVLDESYEIQQFESFEDSSEDYNSKPKRKKRKATNQKIGKKKLKMGKDN